MEAPCEKRCGQPLEVERSSQLTATKELISLRRAKKQNLANNLDVHRCGFLTRTSSQEIIVAITLVLVLCKTLRQSFSGGSDGKASACNMGDMGSISGSGRSPGG